MSGNEVITKSSMCAPPFWLFLGGMFVDVTTGRESSRYFMTHQP